MTDAQLVILRELRDASAESTLVVFTNRLDRSTVATLGTIRVNGIFTWTDVTGEALRETLALAKQGCYVLSPEAGEGVFTVTGSREENAALPGSLLCGALGLRADHS